MKHIKQPTGHSCGPTCIKMVCEEFLSSSPSIEELCEICETDWNVGTPPERMKKGLDYLKLKYSEHIDEKDPFQSLRDSINRKSYCIIRTIIGSPHWILVVGYDLHDENMFTIFDPSSTKPKILDKKYLDKVWKIRNYYYFEIYDQKY